MKAGDLVRVIGAMTNTETIGTLIEEWENINGYDGYVWWTVMISNGELINWPSSLMELTHESR